MPQTSDPGNQQSKSYSAEAARRKRPNAQHLRVRNKRFRSNKDKSGHNCGGYLKSIPGSNYRGRTGEIQGAQRGKVGRLDSPDQEAELYLPMMRRLPLILLLNPPHQPSSEVGRQELQLISGLAPTRR